VTGVEVTLSLTSRISLSLPTRRRGRKTVGVGFGALARVCSEVLTRHYRPGDDAVATRSRGAVSDDRSFSGKKRLKCDANL
jgi:hypothetical protein